MACAPVCSPAKKRVRDDEGSPDDNVPLSQLVPESGGKRDETDDDGPEFDETAPPPPPTQHELASVPSFKLSLPAQRPEAGTSARVKTEGTKSSRNVAVEEPWWKQSARRVLEAVPLVISRLLCHAVLTSVVWCGADDDARVQGTLFAPRH
jgi:hypothetical protein